MVENDERDRLGEQLKDKRKADEDRFFREQERRAIERLRRAQGDTDGRDVPAERCPRCGETLATGAHDRVTTHRCAPDPKPAA